MGRNHVTSVKVGGIRIQRNLPHVERVLHRGHGQEVAFRQHAGFQTETEHDSAYGRAAVGWTLSGPTAEENADSLTPSGIMFSRAFDSATMPFRGCADPAAWAPHSSRRSWTESWTVRIV